METNLPKTTTILTALFRADITTQWRNRRAVIMVLAVPIVILVTWKGLIHAIGGPAVLSTCITIGLISIGLMGYSNAIARDREKGVFQRLRVGPAPAWCIMASRLMVQLVMIMGLTLMVFVVGYQYDKITLTAAGYILTFFSAIVGGAVYLSMGQVIVGRINNPESVNSTTRLVYFLFVMVGMVGSFINNDKIKQIVNYSPYGAVKSILAASMHPATWNNDTTIYLLLVLGYAIVFSVLGIKWFKWNKV
jgi:ABC-2 type transport system permease protein